MHQVGKILKTLKVAIDKHPELAHHLPNSARP
jgi:hypothetical protein